MLRWEGGAFNPPERHMSFDFRIAYPCPHEIFRERAPLASDGRTLVVSSTVVGLPTIYMDGVEVPLDGLQVPARLVAGEKGPYRVYTDTTEFQVEVGGMAYDLELPVGLVESTAVADLISKAVTGLSATSEGGRLVLEDTTLGRASRIALSGPGADQIGFSGQRAARGREAAPSWGAGRLPGTELSVLRPRFSRRPKRARARWEVTYKTQPDRCRRCMSTRVENDIRIDSATGSPSKASNEQLLYQSCMKALLTELGSNPYHRWYGSKITTLVGQKKNPGAGDSIRHEVSRVLNKVMASQNQQMGFQRVTLEETLKEVLNVSVAAHPSDPTTMLVSAIVKNGSFKPIKLTFVFTVPGVSGVLRRNGRVIQALGE
jgi:phage baseplate assembly protein W